MAAKKYLTQRMHSLTHSLIFMAVDIKISFFLRVFYHPLKNKKPVRKSVGIISAMQQSVEQVVGKVTKYAEENPIVVGGPEPGRRGEFKKISESSRCYSPSHL